MHWFRNAALLPFLLALVTACSAGSPELKNRIHDQFADIAFSSEFDGEGRAGHLVKWTHPVRVTVKGAPSSALIPLIDGRLRILAEITRHDIGWASPYRNETNLFVRFVSREQVAQTAKEDAPCLTRVTINRSFEIVFGEIFLAPAKLEQIEHCLTEELAQSLGLLNDSSLIAESIFNEQSALTGLSGSDRVLLETLYDPRLLPGMTIDQAMPIASPRIDELAVRNLW